MFYEFSQVMNSIFPSCYKAEGFEKKFEFLNLKKKSNLEPSLIVQLFIFSPLQFLSLADLRLLVYLNLS